MKHILFTFLIVLLVADYGYSTHQRAAEITYRHVSGLTYEFTIVSYTYTPSPADRPDLELHWGDSSSSILQRTAKINLGNDISRNEYVGTHTYVGPGTYVVWLEDPNRNYGVLNIPGSVNIPMYVETMLVINPFLGGNSSPELLNPPIDEGCAYTPFYHNPGAYDADGDSLAYKLVFCKGAGGLDIPGYSYPQASNYFMLDSISGDLIWDSPMLIGEYNVAMHIEEYRNGILIGYVTRDMQINIAACDNDPPVIDPIPDTCLLAGDTLAFTVTANDPDGDAITLTASGGPLIIANSPADFVQPITASGTVSSPFEWITNCNHIQKFPYQVYFRVQDNGTPVNLIDIETVFITVIGPAPEDLSATAVANHIELSWNKSKCDNAEGYKIFRRAGYYGFFPDHCETGVPGYTAYTLLDEIADVNDTTYIDDDQGVGLIHGIKYCYMVVAYFPDGAESYASLEACASLAKDIPVVTNVSIEETDPVNGEAYVAWSKPTDFDTLQIPGPYKYLIYRSLNDNGSNASLIDSADNLDDTLYYDNFLNTSNQAISYRIDFYNDQPGNRFYVGSTHIASSVYLTVTPSDKTLILSWNENVPWINYEYVIYRFNTATQLFDSIGMSMLQTYSDTGLVNGEEYCYYVESYGEYTDSGFVSPIINKSQLRCGIPDDNVAPCAPELEAYTNCEVNFIRWTNPNNSCAGDVETYELYYTPSYNGDFQLIETIALPEDTFYVHSGISSVAGCYAVVAIDSNGNKSLLSNISCVDTDSCSLYELPNVFTPNGDQVNDFFTPFPYTSVERINIRIYNRWGAVVYRTEDPDIMWDGKEMNTGEDCSDGVYFYVCDVFEIKLEGLSMRTISGSVTLMRGKQ